jgi:hypothetical protein
MYVAFAFSLGESCILRMMEHLVMVVVLVSFERYIFLE